MTPCGDRRICRLLALVVMLASPWPAVASHARAVSARQAPARGSFQLVGHSPLLGRGMNAGLAVSGRYAYVGSRTDGTHAHAGVLVVDIARPSAPRVVGEIGPPYEGNVGESARELRVWPRRHLLIVMNVDCSPALHACAPGAGVAPTIRFYDVAGRFAAAPRLVATYRPSLVPHEFFLWVDPKRPGRALLYLSSPGVGAGDLLVTDISGARQGRFREVASWSVPVPDPSAYTGLHSVSVSPDGRQGYLAALGAGFLVVDTSELARNRPRPLIHLLTAIARRPHWGDPGAHSAVKVPGRPYVLVTDEVYGTAAGPPVGRGCPWGWARLLSIRAPSRPRVVGRYRIAPYNDPTYCRSVSPDRARFASFSAHNPSLTRDLALIAWHSGGLRAVAINDPARPRQTAVFMPKSPGRVQTEDPILSAGRDKVVLWSYPIIKDGLIYVVDIRNGLYILRYRGPFAPEVARTRFLEGNSNVGR